MYPTWKRSSQICYWARNLVFRCLPLQKSYYRYEKNNYNYNHVICIKSSLKVEQNETNLKVKYRKLLLLILLLLQIYDLNPGLSGLLLDIFDWCSLLLWNISRDKKCEG